MELVGKQAHSLEQLEGPVLELELLLVLLQENFKKK